MGSEHDAADRLHEAIEALLSRRPFDAAAVALPAEERLLLGAAERMARLRAGSSANPSPTFVLGLEQQLQADLSLMEPRPIGLDRVREAVSARTAAAALLLGAVLVFGITVAVHELGDPAAGPRDGAARGAEASVQSGGVVAASLETGRVGLAALEDAGYQDPGVVRARVAGVVAAYAEAMRLAILDGSPEDRRSAREASDEAVRDLDRMAAAARARGAVAAVWLAEGAAALQRHIVSAERLPDGLLAAATAVTPPAAASPTPTAATRGAAEPTAAPATAKPATDGTPTVAPDTSPTADGPATATSLPVLRPPDTPATPQPTATVMSHTTLEPPPGPDPIDPTNTPDRWPATSTPRPPATNAPPLPVPTQVRPTEPPAPTSAAATPVPPSGGLHGGRAAPPSR